MASEVILPRVDMDMESGSVSRWLVKEGDTVEKGQVIFEIETDKAAMEIEAETSGVIRGLAAADGEKVPVGTTVAWICAPGEDFAAPDTAKADQSARPAEEARPANGPVANTEVRSGRVEAITAYAAPTGEQVAIARPRATPLARRIARSNDLDLARIDGSGPRGRILRADVVAALERPGVPGRDPTAASPAKLPTAVSEQPALRVLRQGSGAPLVLVHGFASEAASWRPLLAHIALPSPVVTLELPGHGRTELRGRPDFDGLVAFAEDVLRAADLGAIHLVGHSLGGAVSTRLAASGILDLRSMTLIAPAGLGPAINGEFLEGFVAADSEEATAAWMKLLVHAPEVVTPGFVRATVRSRSSERRDEQSRLRRALFPQGTQVFDVRGDLARIAVPTRVLVGAEDRIIPPHQAESLPSGVALHRLAGVGHMPQLEAPALTGRLIGQTVLSAG